MRMWKDSAISSTTAKGASDVVGGKSEAGHPCTGTEDLHIIMVEAAKGRMGTRETPVDSRWEITLS
jgi:hypothetical protein